MNATAALAGFRVVMGGSFAQNRMRSVLSVMAIALGVALGYAVQLINQAAVYELSHGVRALSGDADLQLRGERAGFDETVYPDVARRPEVAIASPVVEVDAKLADRADALRIIGIDVFRAGAIQPNLIANVTDRLDLLRSDALFLSTPAARTLGVEIGGTVNFQSGLRTISLHVMGILGGETQRVGVMDIAGAQAHFDRLGRITRIDLRLRPGIAVNDFRERLATSLPAGLFVQQPEASVAASASVSRSYRVNLNVLALVALFTGGLLIFSTQSLSVVRRRSQLALLRVLGVPRRRLLVLLMGEGAAVGLIGGIAGIGLGLALAHAAIRVFGADLGSGYFRGILPSLNIDATSAAVFVVIGIVIATLASLVPALEAARARPALALKPGDEERAFARLRPPWPGIATLVAGALVTLLPPVNGLPLFGYVAIALLLVGILMLLPALASVLLEALPLPRAAAPRLALSQLRGAPGQVSVSLAAIVASVALTVSMAIMVASFRQSLEAWLEHILPAELYVRASGAGDTGYLHPEDMARIAAVPGVRRAEFLREQQILLDAAKPRVVLLARAIDVADPGRQLPLTTTTTPIAVGAPPPIWVNEAAADVYGFVPGMVVELPIAGKRTPFTVAGIWRDYARPQGAIVIERGEYERLTGDRTATNAALWLTPGSDARTVTDAIARAVPDGERLEIAAPGEIREVSLKIFDRTFAVTYALELAAIVIGLFGLSSAFGALVLTRRREFGVLRHLGTSRRQIGIMLITEGLLISTIGLVVGIVTGWVLSLILIHVVNRQSFHWSMELSIPGLGIGAFALTLLALSIVTVLASGRRAMSDEVVRAVKEDW